MPYIQCKDGKTYSRYDQSDYVKKCICEAKVAEQVRFQKCMLDPECRKSYEQQQHIAQVLLVLLVVFVIVGFFKLNRALNS